MSKRIKRFISAILFIVTIATSMGILQMQEKEKSLVEGLDGLAASYGNGWVIKKEDTEIINKIRKSGKTDFNEGFYGHFDGGFGGGSELYTFVDTTGYTTLEFDVTAVNKKNLGDLESYMIWERYEDYYKDRFTNYNAFKNQFPYSNGSKNCFKNQLIKGFPESHSIYELWIYMGDFDAEERYVITCSNDWNKVKIDVSNTDQIIFYISIRDVGGLLVSNPKLTNEILYNKVNPTSSKVLVNGKDTSFEAYTINGSNYFKLRDIATVVSATDKQFEVSWDEAKKAINLISNNPYTPVGGEMKKGDGKTKLANSNASKIYKDGEEIKLRAYTIGGNNYFKLRDIAQAFNIGVTWDSATSTIGIDTNIDYIEPK